METHIIDIQLNSQPIDEVLTLTSEGHITLDLNTLMQSDLLCEITLEDIELPIFIEDIDEFEDDEFSTNDNESEFLDDINIDLDIDDIFE